MCAVCAAVCCCVLLCVVCCVLCTFANTNVAFSTPPPPPLRQLKKDGFDKDEELTNKDSEFFNEPTAYAMHKMDFKVC